MHYDPPAGIAPTPSDALIDPDSGRLSLPAACGETDLEREVRENVLDQLRGYGLWQYPLVSTLTTPADPRSLQGRALVFRASWHGQPIAPGSEPPVYSDVGVVTTTDYDSSCNPVPRSAVQLVPRLTLFGDSTYYVVLTRGITDLDGRPFEPSPLWELVRMQSPPVVVAEGPDGPVIVENHTPYDPTDPADRALLLELAGLWSGAAPMLDFLDVALSTAAGREDVLLAWKFSTESLTEWLNPSIPDSPAWIASQPTASTLTVTSTTCGAAEVAVAFAQALDPAGAFTSSGGVCAAPDLPCADVGAVLRGTFTAPGYQARRDGAPGRWSDPVYPAKVEDATLEILAFVAAPPEIPAPAGGRPIVVFGPDFGGSKEDLFGLAARLAHAGTSSIAIDWPTQGSRAVRISSDEALGCGGAPSPATAPACFAPLLSIDAATMRDTFRQGMLDVYELVSALDNCGADGAACAGLAVDPARIGFVGQGLGGILGATLVSMTPRIRTAVLSAAGVSILDMIGDTCSTWLKCPFVDALIDAGVLGGIRWDGGANDSALCLGYSWVVSAELERYTLQARWILDPADACNFAPFLRTGKHVLVQQVALDEVVPSWTTQSLGEQMSLTPVAAATGAPRPSGGDGTGVYAPGNAWIFYEDDAFGGKTYVHGSLSWRADASPAARLGTEQMQLDAVEFLGRNL